MDLPDPDALDRQLRELGVGVDASELHGALCGWIAGGGALDGSWLGAVMADPDLPLVEAGSPLGQLQQASASQLEDRDFGLQLLLAEDSASLGERSSSLWDWCRGFLGGFGLAAGAQPPLSEDGREALDDLARLAASSPQEEGDEDDEAALVEIEEFVRVAAMLLHGDGALAARRRRELH